MRTKRVTTTSGHLFTLELSDTSTVLISARRAVRRVRAQQKPAPADVRLRVSS